MSKPVDVAEETSGPTPTFLCSQHNSLPNINGLATRHNPRHRRPHRGLALSSTSSTSSSPAAPNFAPCVSSSRRAPRPARKLAAEAATAPRSLNSRRTCPTEILSFTTHEDCEVFTRGLWHRARRRRPHPGRRVHPRSLLPGPRTQAFQAGRLYPLHRLAGQNSNLLRSEREPPLSRAASPPSTAHNLTLDLTAIKQKGKPKKGSRRQSRATTKPSRSPSPTSRKPTSSQSSKHHPQLKTEN